MGGGIAYAAVKYDRYLLFLLFYNSISFHGKCLKLHIAHILDVVLLGFVTWNPILRAMRSKWDSTQQIKVRQDPKYEQYVYFKICHGMRITSGWSISEVKARLKKEEMGL